MAVVLRLQRGGRKNAPFYQIVAADKKFPRDGRCIERLGHYNPLRKEEMSVDLERAKYFISVGAQPSDTVKMLLRKKGMVFAAPKGGYPTPKPKAAPEKAKEAPAAE